MWFRAVLNQMPMVGADPDLVGFAERHRMHTLNQFAGGVTRHGWGDGLHNIVVDFVTHMVGELFANTVHVRVRAWIHDDDSHSPDLLDAGRVLYSFFSKAWAPSSLDDS